MLSKTLVGTLGVLTATVLTTPAVADASPSPGSVEAGARVVLAGTQVGSEGVRPHVAVPPTGHLVQGMPGGVHGCPACPHPAPFEGGAGARS